MNTLFLCWSNFHSSIELYTRKIDKWTCNFSAIIFLNAVGINQQNSLFCHGGKRTNEKWDKVKRFVYGSPNHLY